MVNMTESNPFLTRAQNKYSENPQESPINPFTNPFEQRSSSNEFKGIIQKEEEESEGLAKSAFRTALQPIMGFLSTTVPGIVGGFWQLLAAGELNDPEEIERLRRISEEQGVPFDEEKYMEAADAALNYVPTVHNIGRELENQTGIPFQPKTRLQKGIRFATEASRLAPEHMTLRGINVGLPKPVVGLGLEGTKEVLQEMGMNEQLAELASFGILKTNPQGAPKFTIGKAEKPSGLTVRRFEKVKEPRKISEARHEKISQELEKDFRNISENIIKESPVGEIHKEIKENPLFKSESQERFKIIEDLAEKIPQQLDTDIVKKAIVDRALKKKGTGFVPGEYEKDYRRFITSYLKETPKIKIGAKDLVSQFRKNNKELSGAYDPAKSKNYNEAKKDALLDYNRSISDVIEKEFPGTEFSKIFPEQNKQWSQILDAEKINTFIDEMFQGKISHSQARKFFDNKHASAPFKRALGDKYPKFEQLMKDILTTEKPYKMLQIAKEKGWNDLFETAGLFVINPKIAAAKKGFDFAKSSFKRMVNTTLDKPNITIQWKSGVDNLKKGDFKAAQADFDKLNKEIKD